MLEMFLPVGCVLLGKRGIANAHEVFRVLLLGCLGKIEASGMGAVLAAAGAASPNAVPHSPQKLSSGWIGAPHFGHEATRGVPQLVHNLRPSRLSRPHLEQRILPHSGCDWSGTVVPSVRSCRSLIMHRVTRPTIEQGVPAARSIAVGLQAVMAPLPPGVTGGIARARHAWRYDDGTFMSYENEEQIRLKQHERMACGGRARARVAKRAPDGTFVA
jgi:hypothetical protein